MSRPELTDAPGVVIPPLLPKQPPGLGRTRADARHPVNGILLG